MKKVLYMLPAEKFGGAERQGTIAIKLLPEYGLNVVPVVGPGEMISEALRNLGVENFIHTKVFPDDPKHPLTLKENIQRTFYNFKCFKESKRFIEDLLKKNPCDVIYATRTFSWIVAGFIGKKTDIPVVWRCGSIFTSEFQRFITRRFMDWSKPKAIVSNSQAMAKSFGSDMDTPSHIIKSSVDLERFNPSNVSKELKQKYNLSEQYKYVGIAARPAPEKGPEFLISILKIIKNSDQKVKFLWAGESSWRNHLQNMFSNSGLKDAIQFLGYIPNIENFYSICDAVVLASKQNSIESSPSALLEPMAMGKPIVASNAGGIPELIVNGENGFMHEYNDAKGFAESILKVIVESETAKTIGENARKYVEANHKEEKNTELLAEVLKKYC